MKISGLPPIPPAAADHSRAPARREAAPIAPAPAPSPAPGTPAETGSPAPEAPAETGKAHGLVRAGGHSHGSDVAALRQWINHPEQRDDLPLPDLEGAHRGNGFTRAVAAYEAAVAVVDPGPPSTDPPPAADPVAADPVAADPVAADPAPVIDPVFDPASTVLDELRALPSGGSGDDGGLDGPATD